MGSIPTQKVQVIIGQLEHECLKWHRGDIGNICIWQLKTLIGGMLKWLTIITDEDEVGTTTHKLYVPLQMPNYYLVSTIC